MFITERKKNGVKVLELNGRVDAECPNFGRDLMDMVQDENNIIVDCSRLNYINSMGLRAFLQTVKEVNKTNGKIIICNLNTNILELFETSGFLQYFDVCKTKEEAMDQF